MEIITSRLIQSLLVSLTRHPAPFMGGESLATPATNLPTPSPTGLKISQSQWMVSFCWFQECYITKTQMKPWMKLTLTMHCFMFAISLDL